MKIIKLLLFVPFVLAASLQAAPIVIDSFSTSQTISGTAGGANPQVTASGLAAPDALGGNRYVEFTRTLGTGVNGVSINQSNSGILEFSTGPNDAGTALLKWDGTTGAALSGTGLGGVDLTSGGTNSLLRVLSRADLAGATVTVSVYTDAANFSTATFGLTPTGFGATPFTVNDLSFAGFVATGGTGANFANVGAVTLFLNGSAVAGLDAQLDLVAADTTSDVPETSSFILCGSGLLLAGFVARRRRQL